MQLDTFNCASCSIVVIVVIVMVIVDDVAMSYLECITVAGYATTLSCYESFQLVSKDYGGFHICRGLGGVVWVVCLQVVAFLCHFGQTLCHTFFLQTREQE